MANIQYYSHILLQSKYAFIFKLIIIFFIYSLFYIDNINDIAYCTKGQSKKLEHALDEIEKLKRYNEYLQSENHLLRRQASPVIRSEDHIQNLAFIREATTNSFKDTYHPFCDYEHDYELSDGRIIRHFGSKSLENKNIIEGRGSDKIDFFYYLRVNPKKLVNNYQEIYYPPNHPGNGYKPHGEVVQTFLNSYYDEKDIPWTLKMCNIL